MPMRIISQGRQAYILAGYLMKRGKWSWQWSERYFVLTQTALHYFKRDRRELYGKERGAFMLDDMVVTEHADKLCIEIKSKSSSVSRMLKAPTEREFLTWCRAFQDALKNRHVHNGVQPQGVSLDSLHTIAGNHHAARPTYSAENSQSQSSVAPGLTRGQSAGGIAAHPLHHHAGASKTTTPLHVRNTTASSNTRNTTAASPGSALIGSTPRLAQSSNSAASPSPSISPLAVKVENADKPKHLERARSSPSSVDPSDLGASPPLPSQQSSAAATHLAEFLGVSPDGPTASGYSSGPSASPVAVAQKRFEDFSSGLHQPISVHPSSSSSAAASSSALANHAVSKLRSSGGGAASSGVSGGGSSSTAASRHDVEDVLRKYSFQDHSPPSTLRSIGEKRSGSGAAGAGPAGVGGAGRSVRDPIAMVTIGPSNCAIAAASAAAGVQPRVIAGSYVAWNSVLSLPSFPAGSSMQVAFADGSTCELQRDSIEKEVKAELREGTRVLPVCGADHEASKTQHQVLISWKCIPRTNHPAPAGSAAGAQEGTKKKEIVEAAVNFGLPLLYTLLFLLVLLTDHRSLSLLSVLLGLLGLSLAGILAGRHWSVVQARKKIEPEWQVTFVSVLETAPPGAQQHLAGAGENANSFVAEAKRDSSSPNAPVKQRDSHSPSSTSSASLGATSPGLSRMKKHGILRRRANDLPAGTSGSVIATIQPDLMARERGQFELSEFESEGESLDSGTSTRENSQIGGRGSSSGTIRQRRGVPMTSSQSHSRGQSSGADVEEEPLPQPGAGLPSSSAPPPTVSPLPLVPTEEGLHASPPPTIGSGLSLPLPSSSAHRHHHRPTSSDSEFTLINSGGSSSVGSSSSAAPQFGRAQSNRSEDSDILGSSGAGYPSGNSGGGAATDIDDATDVESRGGLSEAEGSGAGGAQEGHQEEDESIQQSIQEAMNHYEDTPLPIETSHMPPANPAPWGGWSEDDTSQLKVRGPNFLTDKVKIPVGVPIFRLAHVDMFYTAQSNDNLVHVVSRPGNWGFKYLERREQMWKELRQAAAGAGGSSASHSLHHESSDPCNPLFVMNFLFPGPAQKNMNLVLYFIRRIRPGEEMKRRMANVAGGGTGFTSAAGSKRGSRSGAHGALHSHDDLLSLSTLKPNFVPTTVAASDAARVSYTSAKEIARVCAFDSILRRFLDGPISSPTLSAQAALDDFRDCRFKIIPRIAAGPWIVRKGVGCVPAILGKKVEQKYYRSDGEGGGNHGSRKNYMEVVADVSSSMVAGRILGLVKSAGKALTIDLSFTLQGETEAELPESLLGGVRIYNCDLDKLMEVDEHEKWLKEVWLPKEQEAGRW